MFGRQLGVYVVLAFLLMLVVATQAHAEMSVADWWDTTYSGTYGSFDTAWAWDGSTIFSTANEYHTLQAEISAFAPDNSFGWFGIAGDPTYPSAGYHEIFAGSNSPYDSASVAIPPAAVFDFYLHTPEGNTWHSLEALDPNKDDYDYHSWVFKSTNASWNALHPGYGDGYLIAFEDLNIDTNYDPTLAHWVQDVNGDWVYDANQAGVTKWHTNSEPDNNDMIVSFWIQNGPIPPPNTVPEPGSLSLLAMALCGAVAAGRKRWSR